MALIYSLTRPFEWRAADPFLIRKKSPVWSSTKGTEQSHSINVPLITGLGFLCNVVVFSLSCVVLLFCRPDRLLMLECLRACVCVCACISRGWHGETLLRLAPQVSSRPSTGTGRPDASPSTATGTAPTTASWPTSCWCRRDAGRSPSTSIRWVGSLKPNIKSTSVLMETDALARLTRILFMKPVAISFFSRSAFIGHIRLELEEATPSAPRLLSLLL